MAVPRTGGPPRSWQGRMSRTRKNAPSWRAPIPRRCPTDPPDLSSPPCLPQAHAQRVSRSFLLLIWKRGSTCLGCACGSSKATSTSNTRRTGRRTRCAAIKPCDDLAMGLLCFLVLLVPCQPPLRFQRGRPTAHASGARNPLGDGWFHRKRKRQGKISSLIRTRPQMSWPMVLRTVHAWLEPWILLRRYWNGWSSLPPPPALQGLQHLLEQGQAIALPNASWPLSTRYR